MQQFKIIVTETQLGVLDDALGWYFRFLNGQVNHLPQVLEARPGHPDYNREAVRDQLYAAKKLIWPELHPNASKGVGWSDDPVQQHCQLAYELQHQLRVGVRLCDHEAGQAQGFSRYDSPPLHYSREPLAIVEPIPAVLRDEGAAERGFNA